MPYNERFSAFLFFRASSGQLLQILTSEYSSTQFILFLHLSFPTLLMNASLFSKQWAISFFCMNPHYWGLILTYPKGKKIWKCQHIPPFRKRFPRAQRYRHGYPLGNYFWISSLPIISLAFNGGGRGGVWVLNRWPNVKLKLTHKKDIRG